MSDTSVGGVWLVYYGDHSGAWVFATEIEALRKAVAVGGAVRFVEFGGEVFDD